MQNSSIYPWRGKRICSTLEKLVSDWLSQEILAYDWWFVALPLSDWLFPGCSCTTRRNTRFTDSQSLPELLILRPREVKRGYAVAR